MKPASILCIANQKGGVGKTTTAISLAAALARRGRRVVLVDLDAQANASSIFVEQGDPPPTDASSVYSVFKDRAPVAGLVRPTRVENLFLLPAVVQLAEVETLLAGAVDGFFRLKDALEARPLPCDHVVIDCPPNLGLLTVNSFVAATHLIVPLQTAKFSLDGLKTILETSHTIRKRFNENLRVLGALITMYNPRTAISQAVETPIAEAVPVFPTRISRTVDVEEAHLMQRTIFEYRPKSRAAVEYDTFAGEVLRGVAGADLAAPEGETRVEETG